MGSWEFFHIPSEEDISSVVSWWNTSQHGSWIIRIVSFSCTSILLVWAMFHQPNIQSEYPSSVNAKNTVHIGCILGKQSAYWSSIALLKIRFVNDVKRKSFFVNLIQASMFRKIHCPLGISKKRKTRDSIEQRVAIRSNFTSNSLIITLPKHKEQILLYLLWGQLFRVYHSWPSETKMHRLSSALIDLVDHCTLFQKN